MRYTIRLTVVFLMVLCIGPMSFVSSYSHTAILAEPSLHKDFQVADGEEWLEGWDCRRSVLISGSLGAGYNYQVMFDVTYDSDMQTDFDDLRFTDADGSTLLDYWIEDYTESTSAVVWVEVAALLQQGGTEYVYMYYGNETVSTASNGDDTFLLFDDFNDESLDGAKWSSDGATESGGYLSIAIGTKYIGSVDHIQPSTAIEARTKQAGARKHNLGYATAWAASNPQFIHHASGGNTFMYEGNTDTGTKSYPLDTYCIQSIYWKDADEGEYDVDRAGREDRDDADIPDSDMHVGAQTWGSSTAPYILDWIFVRNWVETEPSIGSFGDEELYSEFPQWYEAGTATLVFTVLFDYWGLNMILVFGGLILMLVCACMAAVKVRDRTISQDSGMLILVVFCVGWGLFIGGTLIG